MNFKLCVTISPQNASYSLTLMESFESLRILGLSDNFINLVWLGVCAHTRSCTATKNKCVILW